ncbi:malto-oligosyltrehalose synthase [Pedobacter sp. GSP4]|uniref:malto-oligosyltrehalose synthase n=1 Tax=Pedobacter sp. GSP4 TaxID=3453716 RepID=UPI003EEDE6CA
MYKPRSTYRIQFNKDFNFKSLERIIPYLKSLGVDTVYASPVFKAMPGSTHGYDVTDPLMINPQIGTEKQLISLSRKLKAFGIGWMQDIVPNHMAFHPDNSWLMDVLKHGKASAFANYFDIDFSDKIMVPFLGTDLEEAVATGAIRVKKAEGRYCLEFGGHSWPVNESGLSFLKIHGTRQVNRDPGLLFEVIGMQNYRPCHWQQTESRINYRRFFTVNSLICLNIQDKEVFDAYHAYIFDMVEKGVFQGLRIDHIDGLFDPEAYLQALRQRVGQKVYITVEKILEDREKLPSGWAAQGTTGYDFLAMVNNLFTNQNARKPFNDFYQKVTGKKLDVGSMVHEKKSAILYGHMKGELDNLIHLLLQLELVERKKVEEVGRENLKKALGEMLIAMPVYRYYNYSFPLPADERDKVAELLHQVTAQQALHDAGSLLEALFLTEPESNSNTLNKKISRFYQRCMQFTGPLMAKGIEDTLMFTYNRFIAHNEVGDAPNAFGLSVAEFHDRMQERQSLWPLALNATATHDTKRGEDVRARLNVLSDIPKEWAKVLKELSDWSKGLEKKDAWVNWLHSNDVYLMIQTILGILPMPGEEADDIGERLEEYVRKALREAKKRSDWAGPDEVYEERVKDFVNRLIRPEGKAYRIMAKLLDKIADFAVVNSLSQLLLKFTCPGIPDIYQGCELWDLSLVDPDNRRPVDFKTSEEMLGDLTGLDLKKLWQQRYSGKIKLWLTSVLMKIRSNYPAVFEQGEYIPLTVRGKYRENIFAFLRSFEGECILVAVPLGMAGLADSISEEPFDWLDTEIVLPKTLPVRWRDLLWEQTGAKDILHEGIRINQIFGQVPIAVIAFWQQQPERSAGILMHISSLPSSFGIGDLGPGAKDFIGFLAAARQRYWQILPLNPTKADTGHSPYSSNSAFAGNVLLISPEGLLEDGLIREEELADAKLIEDTRIDFAAVEKSKFRLLSLAYERFQRTAGSPLWEEYQGFCTDEGGWLEDFALYAAVKNHHQNREWYHWPREYRGRDQKVLRSFSKANAAQISEIKWQQFIFYRQWAALKRYAGENGIKVIGDLPFYVDRDSVEVWAQPEMFKLDSELNPLKIAGVPPDYFNDKGQLWGMPVFDWQQMKADNFNWWKNRLEQNSKLFDLVRLDHFRAFSNFWEVDAAEEDASGGLWEKGPGLAFFRLMEKALGSLPFIAEDLGELSDDVDALRKGFGFPGMKVVQFAFGEDLLVSPNIPHNFSDDCCVVYTGTHDNNTVRGWYENELDAEGKKRLELYAGPGLSAGNVHKLAARMAYSSKAKIAIVPIQDVLGLGSDSRMNSPGSLAGNWLWRLGANELSAEHSHWLGQQAEVFGRIG